MYSSRSLEPYVTVMAPGTPAVVPPLNHGQHVIATGKLVDRNGRWMLQSSKVCLPGAADHR